MGLFRRRSIRPASVDPRPLIDRAATEAGDRIYAIGDIHGRRDLLVDLLDRIGDHAAALPEARTHLVLMGDMVDRGPDSAGVLEAVHDLADRTGQVIALLGNHEELMLRVLAGEPGALGPWLRIGGTQTLRSFGIEQPRSDSDPRAFAAHLSAVLPRAWAEWLRRLPLTARSGDYFFCHAGIRPGVPLHRQSRADLLWIRDEFLEDPDPHSVIVVHGHSIAPEVEVRGNRIGIDTGAYKTGVLTALYLEGTAREVIATAGPPREAKPAS